jgi:surfeit locus 1 family protein
MPEYSPVTRPRARFAPRLLPTLAMLAAVVLFALLGRWQLGRADEKRALQEEFARAGPAVELRKLPEDAPRFQRVSARGHYDAAHQFLLDNRMYGGRPGMQVLTPLVLADGSAVIVNRGWLPHGASRRRLPAVPVGGELREVAGRIDRLPRPPVELEARSPEAWPKLVQYPKMHELAALLERELHPRMILLDPWEPDGYARDWTPPGSPPARNLAYAVQWFAFSLVSIGIWIAVSRRRPEREA